VGFSVVIATYNQTDELRPTLASLAVLDDDVSVAAAWLDRIGDGLSQLGCDDVGGRVLPIWKARRAAEPGGRLMTVGP
jgi:hypothetical protein